MSNETKPWDEQRIIAEAEALAAHFKKSDLDHYEMSRLIVRDMRQVKDSLQQRITDLEAEVTKWRELAEGTASLWVEAREELAKLRDEVWSPAKDGEYEDGEGYGIDIEDNGSTIRCQVSLGFAVTLPDDLRLCKRGDA